MYKRSVRRAYFGISPHLWPFAAWRMLVIWAAMGVIGVFGAAYVGGADFEPLGVALITPFYVAWIAFYLLIPAAVLSILDLLLVRRPIHRPSKFNARPRRSDRQSSASWAGYAAMLSTLFGAAFLFVYLNAFAADRSFVELLDRHLLRFSIGGAGAGVAVAWALNVIHELVPAATIDEQLRRGALVWGVAVAGFASVVLIATETTLEASVLPGVMLAVIGAALIPQLAVTPPTDLSQIPPPQLPTAPSPAPTTNPEGGAGEGAKGDWRNAPPPKFPSPNREELDTRGGGAGGGSTAPPPRTNRNDELLAIRNERRRKPHHQVRSNPDLIEKG